MSFLELHFSRPPAVEDDDDGEEASEEDEEEMREIEAMLYSRIHHAENPDFKDGDGGGGMSTSVVEEFGFLRPKALTVDVDVGDPESGVCSIELSPSRAAATCDRGGDVIDLCESSSSSSSSDSEDDGIQVLSNPVPVSLQQQQQHYSAKDILEVSLVDEGDSSSGGDSDGSVVQLQDIGKVSSNSAPRARAKLVVESPLELEKKRPNKVVVVSKRRESSSSSEDYDSDTCLTNQLSLNILGGNSGRSRSHAKTKTSFAEIVGRDNQARSEEQETPVPDAWDAAMVAFYNRVDLKAADLDLGQVFESMPVEEEHWKIDRADFYGGGGGPSQRYYRGKRCSNCNNLGHLARACTEPLKNSCAMCGEVGHLRYRCPEQGCLRCGRPGEQYSAGCRNCRDYLDKMDCLVCGMRGHVKAHCPDNWRRYHLTTADGVGVVSPPVDLHKADSDVWCVNCGKRGHQLYMCRAYRYSSYPYSYLKVASYCEKKYKQSSSSRNSNWASSTSRTPDVDTRSPARKRARYEGFLRCDIPPATATSTAATIDNDDGDDLAKDLMLFSSKERFRLKRKELKQGRRKERLLNVTMAPSYKAKKMRKQKEALTASERANMMTKMMKQKKKELKRQQFQEKRGFCKKTVPSNFEGKRMQLQVKSGKKKNKNKNRKELNY